MWRLALPTENERLWWLLSSVPPNSRICTNTHSSTWCHTHHCDVTHTIVTSQWYHSPLFTTKQHSAVGVYSLSSPVLSDHSIGEGENDPTHPWTNDSETAFCWSWIQQTAGLLVNLHSKVIDRKKKYDTHVQFKNCDNAYTIWSKCQ